MKFFLDENVPLSAIDVIHNLGFEVEHARSAGLGGRPDREIADYAKKRRAVLVTKDLEFGSLALYPKNSHHGLLVLRLPHYYTASQIAEAIKAFLTKISPEALTGSITVLEAGRYRIRRII